MNTASWCGPGPTGGAVGKRFLINNNKTFRGEIEKFRDFLKVGHPFTLSKYADGEWAILSGQSIDILKKANGEFKYTPGNVEDEAARRLLWDSFIYKSPNYFAGIGCPCCMGIEAHRKMKEICGPPDGNMTFANIWVNGNYPFYAQEIAPLLFKNTAVIVANEKATLQWLPFSTVPTLVKCRTNAWRVDIPLVSEVVDLAKSCTGKIFLFASGPLGNLLAVACNQANPENTYLDIGSTLDPFLFKGTGIQFTRGYLAGAPTLQKMCVWGQ